MSAVLLAHGSASGLAHSVSVPRSAMACSDRGSAGAADSSASAMVAVPVLNANVMGWLRSLPLVVARSPDGAQRNPGTALQHFHIERESPDCAALHPGYVQGVSSRVRM